MASCKECIHHDLCFDNGTLFIHFTAIGREKENVETNCPFKKFKSIVDVVEVKHGRFVKNERNIPKMREFHEKSIGMGMNEKSIFYTCSECGMWASLSQKCCSECGAKLDGGVKSEQE